MYNYKKWLQGVMVAGLAGVSAHALALDWGVGAQVNARYESNATKSSNNEKSDIENIDQADGFVSYQGAHTTVNARYEARHESWRDNSFSNRNTLTGYGQLNWQPTDYFRWYVNNQRRDLVVNNTQADTTSNRNVRSVFTTGTEFLGRVTPVDAIGIDPVYQRVTFQRTSGTDSTRPGATLFWRHLLSEVSTLSLNAYAEKIMFDGNATNDVKRQNVYVGYSTALSRLTYTLQAGYTWTKPDGRTSTNGLLFRFNAEYNYQNQSVKLYATHVVTDNSIGLDNTNIAGPTFNPQDTNIQQFDIVTRDQIYVSYHVDLPGGRWDLGASYRFDMQNFETLPNDERRNIVELLAGYRFNRAFRVSGYGNYERRAFLSSPTNRKDDLYRFGLQFDYRFFRYGHITVGGERQKRDSTARGIEYTNDIAYVRFRLEFP